MQFTGLAPFSRALQKQCRNCNRKGIDNLRSGAQIGYMKTNLTNRNETVTACRFCGRLTESLVARKCEKCREYDRDVRIRRNYWANWK